MTGQLVAALLAGRCGALSDAEREGLDIWREGARIEALSAEAQLADLLQRLAARGLPAMPLKGPLLARDIYDDVSLRPYRDLDLLVHPDDVGHVLRCLLDAGYRHQPGLDADGVAALRGYAGEYLLFRDGALPVEPHWLPAPRTMAFDLDSEAIWRRARPDSFLGAPCYLPAPEDHLLLLAIHGAKEQWHQLKWIADIAALLTRYPRLDLPSLRHAAAAQGCRRVLDLALLLSHLLFAVPATTQGADAPTQRLAAAVLARLNRTAEPPPGPYLVTWFHWQVRERLRDRLRYAVLTLFTPRVAHYQRLKLPASLRWLHVPLKLPWDHIVTPALRAARRLRS